MSPGAGRCGAEHLFLTWCGWARPLGSQAETLSFHTNKQHQRPHPVPLSSWAGGKPVSRKYAHKFNVDALKTGPRESMWHWGLWFPVTDGSMQRGCFVDSWSSHSCPTAGPPVDNSKSLWSQQYLSCGCFHTCLPKLSFYLPASPAWQSVVVTDVPTHWAGHPSPAPVAVHIHGHWPVLQLWLLSSPYITCTQITGRGLDLN